MIPVYKLGWWDQIFEDSIHTIGAAGLLLPLQDTRCRCTHNRGCKRCAYPVGPAVLVGWCVILFRWISRDSRERRIEDAAVDAYRCIAECYLGMIAARITRIGRNYFSCNWRRIWKLTTPCSNAM